MHCYAAVHRLVPASPHPYCSELLSVRAVCTGVDSVVLVRFLQVAVPASILIASSAKLSSMFLKYQTLGCPILFLFHSLPLHWQVTYLHIFRRIETAVSCYSPECTSTSSPVLMRAYNDCTRPPLPQSELCAPRVVWVTPPPKNNQKKSWAVSDTDSNVQSGQEIPGENDGALERQQVHQHNPRGSLGPDQAPESVCHSRRAQGVPWNGRRTAPARLLGGIGRYPPTRPIANPRY